MAIHILSDTFCKPARCIIQVGSAQREFTELHDFLTEVSVTCHRKQAPYAVLQLETRHEVTSPWDMFVPGKPVVIQAAFADYSEEIMRGSIMDIKAERRQQGDCRHLTVCCNDESLLLEGKPVQRVDAKPQPAIQVSRRVAPCRRFSIRRYRCWGMLEKAEGELDGSRYGHVLQVGRSVAVNGLGKTYSGRYYVDSVHHHFTRGSYRQSFTLLRSARGHYRVASIEIGLQGTASPLYEVL